MTSLTIRHLCSVYWRKGTKNLLKFVNKNINIHNWSQYFLIFPCLLLFVCAFRLTYWCWMNINWTLITCFLAPEPRIYIYLRKSLRNVNWAKRRKCRCIRLGAVSKKNERIYMLISRYIFFVKVKQITWNARFNTLQKWSLCL